MQLQLLSIAVRDALPDALDASDGEPVSVAERTVGPPGCRVVCVCADSDGRTVCLIVHSWRPHVLVRLAHGLDPEAARSVARAWPDPRAEPPPPHRPLAGTRLFGFDIDYDRRCRARPLLRVDLATLRELRGARRRFNQLCRQPAAAGWGLLDLAEHRVPPESKFCDEIGVAPSSWLEVDDAACVDLEREGVRFTHCDREYAVGCTALRPCARDDIAPFTMASVDIECLPGPNGAFPMPERDPIICIGTVFAGCGRADGARRVVFALRDCAPVEDCEVLCFDSELDLLQAWRDRVVREQTVVLTGYNVLGFDLRYMVLRHNTLVAEAHVAATGGDRPPEPNDQGWVTSRHAPCRFPMQSMMCTESAKAFEKELCSAAMGWNSHYHIDGFGRFTLDVLMYVKINYKLPRYTLDYVSSKFVGDTKHDITFDDMKRYYDMDAGKRQIYCAYCVQDCMLPIELCRRLFICEDYVQTSRVQWTTLRDIVTRGQQIRVFNMLLRHAHALGFIVDREPQSSFGRGDSDSDDEGYEGATVLPPTTGYYRKAVATLDFASLYPSIMRAHNLCYTTLWPPEAGPPPPWLATQQMEGCTFVVDRAFRGVLPTMLDDLLGARARTKREMAAETDPARKALLDKKQQAQKVSANSVYGFTGAVKQGMYACAEVARTVTAYGRDYIARTRAAVHEGWGLDVIYGDTDSVMVHMDSTDDAWVFRTAEEMGDKISAMFPTEIVLEFEKVYALHAACQEALRGNKREKIDEQGTMDVKGIECARRDNAPVAGRTQRAALDALIMRNDPVDAVRTRRRRARRRARDAAVRGLHHHQGAARQLQEREPRPRAGGAAARGARRAVARRRASRVRHSGGHRRAVPPRGGRRVRAPERLHGGPPVLHPEADHAAGAEPVPQHPAAAALFDVALRCVQDETHNDAKRQFLERMGMAFDHRAMSRGAEARLAEAEAEAVARAGKPQ